MSMISTRKIRTGSYETVLHEGGEQNKETVIFLHGGGPGATAMSNWKDVLPTFCDRYHVLAPDIRGFGSTDHPEEPPTDMLGWMRQRVNQIAALMDELGIDKAHLVGNSMGGALTLNLIMDMPERFNRVILMGSAGASTEPTPELYRMSNFYKDPTPIALENLFRWFVYDEEVLGDKLKSITEERYQEVMRVEVKKSYESMFKIPPFMTIPPSALRRMNHPFLLLHGRDDRFVPYEGSIQFLKHLPNVQLHVFDRCGHWVQVERKKEFIKLVSDFLGEEL
ncbi:alpha/beta fold hydrolase [Bacillus massiliigorillae]|uniref:alpha/beta fold hydrolase n=1 Tax=Bacillus massiliigorillae TaxID=1243664 RepID=UPI0003998248|nr:alpha/beta hydrolase [Bacillus massiliigorillae]